MGRFVYEGVVRAELDDRLLAHLQLVIGTKLRRNEPFYFTWSSDVSSGSGRTVVWVHAAANVVLTFYGSRQPAINRDWIEALMRTANSPTGLRVVPEPAEGEDPSPEVL